MTIILRITLEDDHPLRGQTVTPSSLREEVKSLLEFDSCGREVEVEILRQSQERDGIFNDYTGPDKDERGPEARIRDGAL